MKRLLATTEEEPDIESTSNDFMLQRFVANYNSETHKKYRNDTTKFHIRKVNNIITVYYFQYWIYYFFNGT